MILLEIVFIVIIYTIMGVYPQQILEQIHTISYVLMFVIGCGFLLSLSGSISTEISLILLGKQLFHQRATLAFNFVQITLITFMLFCVFLGIIKPISNWYLFLIGILFIFFIYLLLLLIMKFFLFSKPSSDN